MRIKSVRIHAFGPFIDERLDLAPGLTVVVGDNESGKSSWHAAIFAGMCGMRRGAGRRLEDREFARRHRPWDGDSWSVETQLELADGREIEIIQDLDGQVDCRAVDTRLGRRDVSSEIIFEGSPDASKWLGLDRRTFRATACVGQAEVLEVLSNAEALQEHLQRAAATAGADETAARALTLLEDFQKERVGQDRANAVKPLRQTMRRVEATEHALVEARTAQERYQRQLEALDRLGELAGAAERGLAILNAAAAAHRVGLAVEAAEKAQALIGELDGPAIDLETVRAAGERVSAAIAAWESVPEPPPVSGPTSAELERALAALPSPPVGDLAVARPVLDAEVMWRAACNAVNAHAASVPAIAAPTSTTLSSSELRDLARDLSQEIPKADLDPADQPTSQAPRVAATHRQRLNTPALVVATLVAVAGLILAVTTTPIILIPSLLVAFGLVAFAIRIGDSDSDVQALAQRQEAEARLSLERVAAEATRRVVSQATARATAAGLAPDPQALNATAAEVDNANAAIERRRQWESARVEHAQQVEIAAAALRAALIARGIVEGSDLDLAVNRYRVACTDRARTAQQAARRPDLERELQARVNTERAADDATRRRETNGRELTNAARDQGLEACDAMSSLSTLRQWQEGNVKRLEMAEHRARAQGELDALLRGRSADDLAREADQARQHAEAARVGLPQDQIEADARDPELDARLADVGAAVDASNIAVSGARGELKQLAHAPADVSASEEVAAAARAELGRIRRLDATLSSTHDFLQRAQERVHRDIAPVLEQTLREWLPRVTGGRYTDASVDPESLEVKVLDTIGKFREASLLSQGTREQVYLLLRMALVEHLTRRDEACPLVFDDVTVQTDTLRTGGILELLHEVSAAHQVIVFSQEEDVHRWAEANLEGDRDAVIKLGAQGPSQRPRVVELAPLLVPIQSQGYQEELAHPA